MTHNPADDDAGHEHGQSSAAAPGVVSVPATSQTASTTWEPDRPATATTPSLQQEVVPNVTLNVGYHRTWYGGFLATDGLAR